MFPPFHGPLLASLIVRCGVASQLFTYRIGSDTVFLLFELRSCSVFNWAICSLYCSRHEFILIDHGSLLNYCSHSKTCQSYLWYYLPFFCIRSSHFSAVTQVFFDLDWWYHCFYRCLSCPQYVFSVTINIPCVSPFWRHSLLFTNLVT